MGPRPAGVGSGGSQLEANRARFRGLTACEARFYGVEDRLPPSFFGGIGNSRDIQNSPNFQDFRDIESRAPKRVASFGISGPAGVGSGGSRLAANLGPPTFQAPPSKAPRVSTSSDSSWPGPELGGSVWLFWAWALGGRLFLAPNSAPRARLIRALGPRTAGPGPGPTPGRLLLAPRTPFNAKHG